MNVRNIREIISVMIVLAMPFARHPFFIAFILKYKLILIIKKYTLSPEMHNACFQLKLLRAFYDRSIHLYCVSGLSLSLPVCLSVSLLYFSLDFHLLFMLLIISPVNCRSAFQMV